MRHRGILRVRAVIGLGLAAALVAATPVAAYVEETGTKNCGDFIGFVHARYYDQGWLKGPGGTTMHYGEDDNAWHVRERNGGYSGSWSAKGDPDLDTGATYAGCRNYG